MDDFIMTQEDAVKALKKAYSKLDGFIKDASIVKLAEDYVKNNHWVGHTLAENAKSFLQYCAKRIAVA